jgi:2,3-dihydroxyphenylpropionate 1,2-dioxygenase
VLDRLTGGALADLVDDLSHPGDRAAGDLVEVAGNGGNELRNWIAMVAACGWAPGRALCYSAMPEWLTGMGVAVIDDPRPTTTPHRLEK